MQKTERKEHTVEDVGKALNEAMSILKVDEYDVKIEIQKGWHSAPLASYYPPKNLIEINMVGMLSEYELYEIPMRSFATTILAHEMGHHIHSQLPCGIELNKAKRNMHLKPSKIARRLVIEGEKKAWEHGSRIIPVEMQDEFDYMNKMNLINCSYWRNIGDRMNSFRKLEERYGIGK